MLTILKHAWSHSRSINVMFGGSMNLIKYSIPICNERSFVGKLVEVKVTPDNIVLYFKVKEPSESPLNPNQILP